MKALEAMIYHLPLHGAPDSIASVMSEEESPDSVEYRATSSVGSA